ncbi:hypothetical protein ACL00X_10985 [Aeromonas diversa]|uniref:hypothetical protein n=1 Tax=Aeromonas diversa TaxID=502790 RepID=UPI0039A35318
MSVLDPVILNRVTKVADAVAKLAVQPQGDTVLLDIPVRKGHAFAEGDLALYDVERGDLHDGRAELETYFSPASGGNNWVAAARQAVGFHERADGSLIVASLFRQASATETSSSAPRLEVGYRAPDGTWQYAGVLLSGNGTHQTYPVQSMRFVQISADEYFVVLTTYNSNYSYDYFTSVISIRIVAGAPVIGAISSANEFNHVRFNATTIMFAIGDSELMVLIPDTSSPKATIFKSAAGVISKTTVADAAIPKVTDVYQIDSKRILFADAATPRLGRIEAGAAVFDTVTLDTSRLTDSVSYTRLGGFTGAGYAEGTDVQPGVFAPADLGAGRVFVTSTTFGGFEVDGLTVRVFPPINGGAIGDDLIFYPGEVPATARHPLFLGGAQHSGICYGAQFVRKALCAAGSVNSDLALVSGYTRASIKGQYVEGGVLFIRQSGPSALAPIGAGGKVVGRRYDPALAKKAEYADVAGLGLLLRPSYSGAGRDRYPGSTVYVRERTPSQDFMLPALAGPVRVSFTGIASQITTTTKFWSVVDGQWSVKSVLYASGNQAPYLPGTATAVKEAAFYWDFPSRVLSSATPGLTITVAEVSI